MDILRGRGGDPLRGVRCGLIAAGAALAAAPGQARACTPLPDRIREIGAALDEVRLDDAAEAARLAEQELACQADVVSSLSLVALYQLEGAVQMFLGDAAEAELAFGRAIAVSPTARLDAGLGADAEDLYEQVRGRALAIPGGLVGVDPVVRAWVDGRRLEADRPVELAAGQHLAQVERGGELTGRSFRLGPGEVRSINAEGRAVLSGEPEVAAPAANPADSAGEAPRSGPRWTLVAAGGAGLAAGAISLAVASGAQSAFEATDSYEELAALQVRTNALAVTGYTLAGLGLGLGVVGFVDGGGYTLGATWRW